MKVDVHGESLQAYALQAMGTRFELLLPEGDEARQRAIAEEAFEEITRVEHCLSPFMFQSDLSRFNRAPAEPGSVSPLFFDFLSAAKKWAAATQGAFDPTLAPLLHAWGILSRSGAIPSSEELEQARSLVGIGHLRLDPANLSAGFERPGMSLDPGAIGKGFAIDHAIARLREQKVEHALLHGGTSTVFGFGKSWKISLPGGESVSLQDEGLSFSCAGGQAYQARGRSIGHILDPSAGQPLVYDGWAAVIHPQATASDALSTALLVERARGNPAPSWAAAAERLADGALLTFA